MKLKTMEDKVERERGHIALDRGHLEKREQLLQVRKGQGGGSKRRRDGVIGGGRREGGREEGIVTHSLHTGGDRQAVGRVCEQQAETGG